MKINAIVAGSTGLVGTELVKTLCERKEFNKITLLVRKPIHIDNKKINCVVVDFNNLDSFKEYIVGDVLFSCIGTTKKQAGSIEAQRKVDVDYQLQLAKLASENDVRELILVSSIGANSASHSPYLKMKGELEQKVSSLPIESISIFRPSFLLGKRTMKRQGEGIGAWLFNHLSKVSLFGNFKPINAQQLATKMVAIALKEHKEKRQIIKGRALFE